MDLQFRTALHWAAVLGMCPIMTMLLYTALAYKLNNISKILALECLFEEVNLTCTHTYIHANTCHILTHCTYIFYTNQSF